ncbi:hypothetical protein PM03_06990 [Thalassobacter stenotrophicus]|uniref:tetratricopeptide repeat protein n=1 Tax=Thalassobacter TaxID=266808 RepID=UPI00051CFD08|nr:MULTISPECIES: tetratricopeptide repeat protein [Thalassobacter]KGK79253.1 hypothetical protein PM03_06990 [Thalassobacter stenotrophicus]KGL00535.1 hypothetical protein PM04_14200 [Thalassobacter sp. 16PALIMAR09]
MRHVGLIGLLMGGTVLLAGCEQPDTDVSRALDSVNVIDESNLNDIMLTVADPNEAVDYFLRTSRENPDRIDVQRGLAKSLIRAKRNEEAALAWEKVADHSEASNDDRVDYADSLIRTGKWDKAEDVLDTIPPTYETYSRYRLEAMIADSNQEWEKADAFYEIATGLTTRPAGVLNNWGFSKLTRGDYGDAERLFTEAITYDRELFTAKNNLVLARTAQANYTMPVVPMTKTEQAQLLHTAALAAIKQGETDIGRTLLQDAIDAHPQHFAPAVRALRALDTERT